MASGERTGRGWILSGGVALMGAAAGAGFGRLFVGGSAAWRLAAAGAVAGLLGGLLERRGLTLTVAASVGMLAVFVGVTTFPGTTFLGIPTLETGRSVARALSTVAIDAAHEYTPANPLPSLVTAAIVAIWCASTAAHALAARAAVPVLAVLPPGLLLGFAASLAADGPRPRYAIPFLVGALVMLYATGRRRLEAWGPSGGAQRRFRDAAGRHARWLAAGSLALALLAPGILPGLAAGPLVDVAGPIETQQATVSPIVDIRPSLTANRSVELFRVRSERPAYWRLLSLDRFDGRFWTAPERVVEDQMVISGPSDLPVAEPALHDDGDLAAAQDGAIEQEFEILGLRAEWLPSAYLPVMSTTPGLAVWDPREATLRPVDEAPRGYRYRVWSHLAAPTPADLRAIPRLADSLAVDASLPVATPPRVYAIAEALTRGEETPYEKLLAIQDHLRTFAYDEAAPPGHGTSDILFFLERSRRGYCEQFAGTMAVLARALGYRARVAIGFTPGNPAADGSFVVTSEHVHAWTEVYFPSIGWLAFEPTPARTNPVAGDYADPAAAIANPGGSENDQRRTQNREAGRSQRDANEGAPPDPNAPAAADRTGGMSRWWMLAALPLVPVGVVIARLGRRAMRRRRARTDRDRILAAYEGFTLVAEDLGFGRRDGETPAEFAARLRAAVPFSDGHLERLSALAVTALYSERTTSAEAPAVATEAERAVVRDLRRHAGAARSFAGTLGLRR